MSGAVVLEARNLAVARGSGRRRFELEVGSLELRAGEALVVLGPNGAGKTTLLRALAGLEAPLRGEVRRRPAADGAQRPVTMVFQRPVAFSGTVAHNVRAALYGRGLSRAQRRERAHAALEHFGIAPLASRRVSGLSGGELRRLALARAFALEPAALLLDEPFDDLDAGAQDALAADLHRVLEHSGVAAAIVTHDLGRAAALARRIAVVDGGRLLQVAARDVVLERPASVAVAAIVGMSNRVPGRVRHATVSGAGARLVVGEDALPVGADVAAAWPDAAPAVAGIRPEHLKLDVGRGDGEAIGKARVRELRPDGMVVHVLLDWGPHALRAVLIAGRGLARTLRAGDVVSLSVRAEDVHLMPAE